MVLLDRDRLTCIGVVAHAHGVRGELKVTPVTDNPEYYQETRACILETSRGLRAFDVTRLQASGRQWIMALAGVTDRSEAETLKGAAVLLEESQLKPLAPGEYFRHDLIGCAVETMAGEVLGRIEEILETGANDVLTVARGPSGAGRPALLVPMVHEVVKAVDMERRLVRIEPLPGMLD